MCRFLTSLVTHIRDSSSHVGVGFVIYALHLNPRLLQGIFANVQNIASLRQALGAKKLSGCDNISDDHVP